MFVITLKDNPQGIYSVFDKDEERVVPLFEQADDAVRYVMAINESDDDDNPELQVVNVEPEQIMYACRQQGQRFSIITGDDLIIPPDEVVKIDK